MSKGLLPWWSDRAPVTGDDRNCSRENNDPMRPERQIEKHAKECSFFSLLKFNVSLIIVPQKVVLHMSFIECDTQFTSKQDTVVFLFQRNPYSLPEPVHNTLQRLIHDVLSDKEKHRNYNITQGQYKHQRGQFSMSQRTDSHADTAHDC